MDDGQIEGTKRRNGDKERARKDTQDRPYEHMETKYWMDVGRDC